MNTVVGLFRQYANAEQALDDLLANRFEMAQISAIVPESALKSDDRGKPTVVANATGVFPNPGILGLGGVISGIKGSALPGLGTVRTSGPLLQDNGPDAGLGRDLHHALVAHGIAEEDAEAYSEAVRRGGVLLAVETEDRVSDAKSVMLANNGADVAALRQEFGGAGQQNG